MNQLRERRGLDEILAARDDAIDRFGAAVRELESLWQEIEKIGFGDHAMHRATRNGFTGCSGGAIRAEKIFRQELDRDCWRFLADVSGMEDLMDSTQKERWKKDMEFSVPECTLENVESTFEKLHENRELMLSRSVVESFRFFNRNQNYKSNDGFSIGRKLIVEGTEFYSNPGCEKLRDVERILYVMDGKKPPIRSKSIGSKISGREPSVGETEYMTWRKFKNGNCHVTWKRMDLIERCNEIIAAYYGDRVLPDGRR